MAISKIGSDGLNQAADTILCADSGNVGIGTSSPVSTAKTSIKQAAGGGAGSTQLHLEQSNTTDGYDLKCDSADGALAFLRYASGSATERARIDSSGILLVGKTATSISTLGAEIRSSGLIASTLSGSTSGTSTLEVYSTGASAYRFFVGMNGTVYATNTTISALSDQRHKENVRDLDAGLAEVMALKPRLYDWKEGKGADIKNARGFIAQEFEEVFPDLIDEWKDPAPEGEEPYKSVRADLIPVLVKAIQELKSELDTVKAELATLKGN